MSFVSYAQNYEDVMLTRALRGVEHGFYIDVGAQDPIADSVTKAFYERGWSGINIEPVTHWFQRLVADRPHDTNLQLAVSDRPGQLHLFEVVDSGLSTTDPEFAARHAHAGHEIHESDVDCVTLDAICRAHRVREVHFLKIDCEGAEAAALRGLSLQQVRPWIILLEATEPNSQKPAYAGWEPLLTERGYHFVYEDGLNRFYVADEHVELDQAFSHPPNVFDYFMRASEAIARNQLQTMQADLDVLRDAQRVMRAEFDCERLRTSVEYLNSENERREAALVEHRRALDEAAKSLNRMHHEREQWRNEAERLREENERAEQFLVERQQAVATMEGSLSAMRADLAAAAERTMTLGDELANREHELTLLRADVDGRAAEIVRLQNEIGRLHREVALRDQEVGRLRGLIQAVERSTSWRITLPLRLSKRAVRAMVAMTFFIAYQMLRWPARFVRPFLRLMARWSWLRSLAVRITGPDSRLTAQARLFLFGAAPPVHLHEQQETVQASAPLTRQATRVLEEIQDARRLRLRSNSPSLARRK